MGYYTRLTKAFEGAIRLPLNHCTKYVLFSDCHRGIGTSNDNFLKNQHLYFAALRYYYQSGHTYIELGDGDELWENRRLEQIIEIHGNVFWLLSLFQKQGRLYMIYGNHDIVKKYNGHIQSCCDTYPCCCGNNSHWEKQPLLPDLIFYEGIILESTTAALSTPNTMAVYLTHGHQADFFNSTLWPLSRFLVRYLWKPLEHYGFLDPTSAAKNFTRKQKTEKLLHHWAEQEKHILITGHTHRPALSEKDIYYYNCGSCVHPRCITCLEIEDLLITLVKWTLNTGSDRKLYVERDVLAGPLPLFDRPGATG